MSMSDILELYILIFTEIDAHIVVPVPLIDTARWEGGEKNVPFDNFILNEIIVWRKKNGGDETRNRAEKSIVRDVLKWKALSLRYTACVYSWKSRSEVKPRIYSRI
jgi:hypothetical protein